MHRVLVAGAGKIGSLITTLLATSNDYKVYLADVNIDNPVLQKILGKVPNLELVKLDAQNPQAVVDFLKKTPVETILSALPFYLNIAIIKIAKDFNLNYFDLTEDTATAKVATEYSQHVTSAFVPQCGLAPGFISIVANHLMEHFPVLDAVKMRVGALPLNISNSLQYSLTWSTDGLINEYGNHCQGIEDGKEVTLLPLENLEKIKIDGLTYEAFNTSGGIGSLADSYMGRIKQLTYKTIRYPGHCAKIRFLMNDLNLNQDRDTLKRILENALPKTVQDVVLVYVSVTGKQDGVYTEENYVKKFYPKKMHGHIWSAIQLTTASGICAVLDLVVMQQGKYKGLVKQEQFSLEDLTSNRFGQYYN